MLIRKLQGGGPAYNDLTDPFAGLAMAPYVSQYAGLPVEELQEAGDIFQGRWEEGKAAQDVVEEALQNVLYNVDESDKELAQKIYDKYMGRIEGYKERGDYHNFFRDVKNDVISLEGTVTPILQKFDAIQQQRAALKAQGMSEDQINARIGEERRRMGSLSYDDETLRVTGGRYVPSAWASEPNMRVKVDQMISGIQADSEGKDTGWLYNPVDNTYRSTKTDEKWVSEDEARRIIANGMLADSDVRKFVEDEYRIAISNKEASKGEPLTEKERKAELEAVQNRLLSNAMDYGVDKIAHTQTDIRKDIRLGHRASDGDGDNPGNDALVHSISIRSQQKPVASALLTQINNPNPMDPFINEYAKSEYYAIQDEYEQLNPEGRFAPYYEVLKNGTSQEEFREKYVEVTIQDLQKTKPEIYQEIKNSGLETLMNQRVTIDNQMKDAPADQRAQYLDPLNNVNALINEAQAALSKDAQEESKKLNKSFRSANQIFRDYQKELDSYSAKRVITEDLIYAVDPANRKDIEGRILPAVESMSLSGSESNSEESEQAKAAINKGTYAWRGIVNGPAGLEYVYRKTDPKVEGESIIYMSDPTGRVLETVQEATGNTVTKSGFGNMADVLHFSQQLVLHNIANPKPGDSILLPDELFPDGNAQNFTIGRYGKRVEGTEQFKKGYTLEYINEDNEPDHLAIINIVDPERTGDFTEFQVKSTFKRMYGEDKIPKDLSGDALIEWMLDQPALLSSAGEAYMIAYSGYNK